MFYFSSYMVGSWSDHAPIMVGSCSEGGSIMRLILRGRRSIW